MNMQTTEPPLWDWLMAHCSDGNRAELRRQVRRNRDRTAAFLRSPCQLTGADAVVFQAPWFNPHAEDVDNYATLALNVLRSLAMRLRADTPDTTDPAKLAALIIQAGEDLQAAGEEMLAWQECDASEREFALGAYDPVEPVPVGGM